MRAPIAVLFLTVVLGPVPCSWVVAQHGPVGPTSAGANGPGHPDVVDHCDGSVEFLGIPPGADIVFSAGFYAEGVGIDAPAEVYALDLDGNRAYRVSCSNFEEPRCAYSGPSVAPDRNRMVAMRACTDTNRNGRVDNFDTSVLAIIDLGAGTARDFPELTSVNSPHWSIRNEIVFAAQPPGELETDIFTITPDATAVSNLTVTPGVLENDPSWSHDGGRIVFARGVLVAPPGAPAGTLAAETGLWIMGADGSHPRKVVSFSGDPACPEYSDAYCRGLAADPGFAPDDAVIYFERLLSVEENQGSGRFNIFRADASGLDVGVTNLTDDPTAYQSIPDAGPRGLLFHEVDTAKPFYGIVMTDGEGRGREVVVDGTAWTFYLGSAHWLDSGRRPRRPTGRVSPLP